MGIGIDSFVVRIGQCHLLQAEFIQFTTGNGPLDCVSAGYHAAAGGAAHAGYQGENLPARAAAAAHRHIY